MTFQIYARRMSIPIHDHEYIARVRYIDVDTKQLGEKSRAEMVEWLSNPTNHAFVADKWKNKVEVHIVRQTNKPSYIQTKADGVLTDNLLKLPPF